MIEAFWRGLSGRARAGLVASAVAVVLVTAVAGYLLLHTDYQVLFADLSPQDAAAMAAELDRQKIAYRFGEEDASGSTILVDRKDVYRTRIKLMGKDLPLHGAVGFELFNNSDFGMTEFSQHINYQRALQGELVRTILSIAELRDARVLLALPEQGLFKQGTARAKASVTLTVKPGFVLRPEQVTGIQRLVSAAVPGIATQDVTIVDQSGVALTRVAADGEPEGGGGRLDLKKDTENYLSRKASEVLERVLGAGQALVSVDVTLDMDRVQTTTEDVVGAPAAAGQRQTGVVVRERESLREGGAPLDTKGKAGASAGSSQRELEYAVGRRVEQVINLPGSIRRIQAVAVVKKPLDTAQQERIRATVAAAVGASQDRGDTVVVQSMEGLRVSGEPAASAVADRDGAATGVRPGRGHRGAAGPSSPDLPVAGSTIGLVVLGVAVPLAFAWALSLGGRARRRAAGAPPALSDAQRQAALAQVQAWIRADDAPSAKGDVA